MALSTFSDLKNTAATFLNRTNLTSLIPYFVQLCETKIAYGDKSGPVPIEPLRIRAMESHQTATVSSQYIALPDNYLQSRRFYLQGDPVKELTYIVPDLYWKTFVSSNTGEPTRFTVEGENFVFGPIPDASYTADILFYQKFAALSADADTNWLLQNAFGVYLNGTLAEAFRYARNDEQADARHIKFAGQINALNSADKQDRYSGSPWQAFTDTGNP